MTWTLQYIVWITFVVSSGLKDKTSFNTPTSHVSSEDTSTFRLAGDDNYQHVIQKRGLPHRPISAHSPSQKNQKGTESRINLDEASARMSNGSVKNVHTSHKRKKGMKTSSADRIVFPGPNSKSIYDYEPEIPEECQAKGYCERIPNYPVEHVRKLILELGDKVNSFHKDDMYIPEINSRIPLEKNIELCDSRKKILYPELLKDNDGNWHTAINDRENPVQSFLVELCTSENSRCSSKINRVETGYDVSCLQKRVLRNVAVMGPNNKMVKKHLVIPSCCTCVAHSVDFDI